MIRKYGPTFVAATFVVAFLLSGVDRALPTDSEDESITPQVMHISAELEETLRTRSLDDVEIERLVEKGHSSLNYIIDDFMRSKFVGETLQLLKRDFNLGRELDESIYASNVIRIAESFGPAGIHALIGRLDPEVVEPFQLRSREFREMGAGIIKPLLTMEMLLQASEEDLPAVKGWLMTFLDERRVREINNLGGTHVWPWVAAVAASVAGAAVWEGAKWAYESFQEQEDGGEAYHEYWEEGNPVFRPQSFSVLSDQLSEAERNKMKLRSLDPVGR